MKYLTLVLLAIVVFNPPAWATTATQPQRTQAQSAQKGQRTQPHTTQQGHANQSQAMQQDQQQVLLDIQTLNSAVGQLQSDNQSNSTGSFTADIQNISSAQQQLRADVQTLCQQSQQLLRSYPYQNGQQGQHRANGNTQGR